MKKIIMLALSFTLVFSSAAPFIINASAETNTTQNAQITEISEEDNNLEYITISSDGHEAIELSESDKEIVIDVEKNSKLENEKVKIALPKGITYSGKEDNVSYDEEKNEVTVNMNEVNEEASLKLAIDVKEADSSVIILEAVLEAEKKADTIISNPFKMEVVEKEEVKEESTKEEKAIKEETTKEETTEKEENAVVENKSTENSEEKKDSKVKITKNTKSTKDNGNGMTTKEGVPNAPSPEVETRADGSNEVNVSNWTEFDAAMKNKNINEIHVTADFANPSATNVGAELNTPVPMRPITINGNGHIIDFKNVSYYNNGALGANTIVEWEVNHLTMYGRNFYGPLKTASSATAQGAYGAMVYDNVTYVGAQLTASYYWTIDFAGTMNNHSVNSYVSPFDEKTYSAQTNQANIEATDVVFRENSTYNGTTTNAGVFRLQNSGKMTLEDNADVTMTSGGASGESGGFALYLQGLIKTGKDSKLTINGSETGNQYGINIVGNNNGIHAEDGSKIDVNTYGVYSSITMDNYTSIIVEDGAALNVISTGKAGYGYNVINAGAYTTFLIGEKASFNATSDGTGTHAILAFGGNSKFQFADAENVNLQFTNDNLATNSRVIYMAGQLEVDVQEVKAWNRTDVSGNAEREADFRWTPMFGMVTQFNGYNDSVVSASSVMNSEREKYKAEFKPSQFSRLQYSYIEDVETGILNPLTDNITSVDSEVIKGVANPGAYVRLTGDPALPEATIPSIVDGAEEAELTDDFTVIADETGNFEVKAKEGMHFTASNDIKAYAFLGGKSDSHTVKVLDETAPTGEGVNLSMIYDDTLPQEKQFVINPKDTNPANEGFTYNYKEDYSALKTQEGIHDIVIMLGDTAGNKAEIPVKLEVTKDGYGIKADDFTIKLSDLKQYDTDEKLTEFLLTESKATAYGVVENESQDLTEHLTVNDLANIDQMKAGKYDIKIGFDLTPEVPDAKVDREFTVTVLNDEEVNPTNPENPGGEEPEEVENGGTGQAGLLKLDYAPSNFAFGEVEFGFDSVKTNAVKTTSDKQWLQVSDHRADEDITNWSVQVSENHELATAAGDELVGSTISIPKGKMYNEKTGEEEVTNGQLNSEQVDVTTTPQTIFSADNTSSKIKNTSTNVWQATDVSLAIPGGQEADFTDYSNTVTWSLVAEPTE